MHEFSVAGALLDLAQQHVPGDAALRGVKVRAGPMRAIDPQSMRWAWDSTIADRKMPALKLDLELLPWHLHCPDCHRDWKSEELDSACTCGCKRPHPIGGDELQLVSVEVD